MLDISDKILLNYNTKYMYTYYIHLSMLNVYTKVFNKSIFKFYLD